MRSHISDLILEMTPGTYRSITKPRLLICGSRGFSDRESIAEVLHLVRPSVLINGGARGADTIAAGEAKKLGIEVVTYKAEWGIYGKAAGPRRNHKMLTEGAPDIVIAFYNRRRTPGTAHMVKIAREAGVTVFEFGLEEQ